MTGKVLEEDLGLLCKRYSNQGFEGKTVLITGVTGMVGSLLAKTFIRLSNLSEKKVKVIGLARSAEKLKAVFGDDAEKITAYYGDICNSTYFDEIRPADYIIHTANATASKFFLTHPVETIETICTGTANVMKYAVKTKPTAVIYVSSMEVYGVVDASAGGRTDENSLGKLDILNPRSCYSEGKRLAECMCRCYMEEYGVPVRMARLAQTFGPGVSENDNRVFMQFARSAMASKDIVLHTTGESFGNYCYSRDAVSGLLTILLKGTDGESYNVVNESTTMQIRDMAKLVSDVVTGGKIRTVIDIPEGNQFGYAPATALKLSGEKLMGLGWKPEIEMTEAYERLIEYIKEI